MYPHSGQDYPAANKSVPTVRPHSSGEVWRAQGQSDGPEDVGRSIQFPFSYFEDGNLDLFTELGGFDSDLAASMGG